MSSFINKKRGTGLRGRTIDRKIFAICYELCSEKGNVLLTNDLTLKNGLFRHFKMNMGNLIYKDKEFDDLPTEEKLLVYPFILNKSGISDFKHYVYPAIAYHNQGCCIVSLFLSLRPI